jgi:hypothetical protein
VAEYQHDVEVAKTRLEEAVAGRVAGDFQVWLRRAEAERRTAERNWKNAMATDRSAPETFGPLDVERFRLRAEVASCNLSAARRWSTPAARPNYNGKSIC